MVPASVDLMTVLLFRLKDEDLLEAPDDPAFLQSLRFSCARVNGVYPPLARLRPSLLRRTVPKGAEATPYSGLAQTPAVG